MKYSYEKKWFLFMCFVVLFFPNFPVFAANLAPTPVEEVDIHPALKFTTAVPAEITQKTLDFKGVATGANGIREIRITVDNLGIEVVSTFEMRGSPQEDFWITVPLDFGKNVITFEAIDKTGQIGEKEFAIVRPRPETPTPHAPTPVPTLSVRAFPTPTPSPTPVTRSPLAPTPTPSRIVQLLKQADEYFDKQWFLTPKDTNAFDVYAEVLRLEPSNRYARQRLQIMMQKYYNWGVNNFTKGAYEKTQSYYQRYITIAEFLVTELGEQELTQEIQKVQDQLAQIEVTLVALNNPPTPTPPTPTPLPVVSPLPTSLPTPPPTPELAQLPTQTPLPEDDQPPSITLTSEIPAETDLDTLKIAGVASDDHGVEDVTVSVRKAGTKGLMLSFSSEKGVQQKGSLPFEKSIQLTPGTHTVLIEAYDTKGQVSQEKFQVVRRQIEAPSPAISAAVDVNSLRPGDVYAVIIGIGTYADERLNLRYTVNDAQGLYDLLTHPDYGGVPQDNIRLLLDEDATDRGIKGAIGKWLSRRAKEEDTVIIYYSGHGAPEGDETYWVTYNADIDDLYTTALDNNEIADMLSRIRSKRMLTFLDSCYSAATVNRKDRTRSAPTEIPWEKFGGEGRVTISASDGKQLSLELEEYGHGVFTYYLLEGLKGQADANKDGVVEVGEIWDYVKSQVRETAQRAGNSQTPVFQGSLSAGIPLTFNMGHFRALEQQQMQEAQQQKLAEFYAQGKIGDAHFICAVEMLDAGTSNVWLDKLLADKITPDIFNRFFSCESQ